MATHYRLENAIRKGPYPFYRTEAVLDGSRLLKHNVIRQFCSFSFDRMQMIIQLLIILHYQELIVPYSALSTFDDSEYIENERRGKRVTSTFMPSMVSNF